MDEVQREPAPDYDSGTSQGTDASEPGGEVGRTFESAEQRIDVGMEKAKERVDEGIGRTANRLDSGASRLREVGQREGSEATLKLADDMETAAAYLKERSAEDIVKDVEVYVKQHPTQALVAAVVAGIVLGRMLR